MNLSPPGSTRSRAAALVPAELESLRAELQRVLFVRAARALVLAPGLGVLGLLAMVHLTGTITTTASLLGALYRQASVSADAWFAASIWISGAIAATIVGPYLGAMAVCTERDAASLSVRVVHTGARRVLALRAAATATLVTVAVVIGVAIGFASALVLGATGAVASDLGNPVGLAKGIVTAVGIALASWAVSFAAASRWSLGASMSIGSWLYVGGVITRELLGRRSGVIPAFGEIAWVQERLGAAFTFGYLQSGASAWQATWAQSFVGFAWAAALVVIVVARPSIVRTG
jgi:hypothetical protein